MGLALWEQYTVGFCAPGSSDFIKLCISVGLSKVNVGFVLRVTKTLFELIVALPDWYKAWRLTTPELSLMGAGVGAGTGVMGAGAGATAGLLEAQTEGCPEQVQLAAIWQLMHPGEKFIPESQVYPPIIKPSPHVGVHTPWELGV